MDNTTLISLNLKTNHATGPFATEDEAIHYSDARQDDYVIYNVEDAAKRMTVPALFAAYNITAHNGDPEHKTREAKFKNKAEAAAALFDVACFVADATSTKTKKRTGGGKRNGNVAKVWELCEELAAKGEEVVRKDLLAKAAEHGIPKATASTQLQRWRHAD